MCVCVCVCGMCVVCVCVDVWVSVNRGGKDRLGEFEIQTPRKRGELMRKLRMKAYLTTG